MATITGLTAARLIELTNLDIVGGTVNGLGNLILTTRGGSSIDAGPIILAGTSAQYFRGDKSWATMDKAAVGLSLVDNVADVNKPVSIAQKALFVPKWKTATVYAIGDQVVTPNNDIGKATSAHTSAAAYATDVAKWNIATSDGMGQIAQAVNNASYNGIAGTNVVADYVQVTLVAGRRYRAYYRFTSTTASANEAMAWTIVKSATSDVTTAGTMLDNAGTLWTAPAADSGSTHYIEVAWAATTTETVNIKVNLQRVVGASGVNAASRRLTIVDEGAQF